MDGKRIFLIPIHVLRELTVKLRLPICESFQLFHSHVYFILFSVRKVTYIGER